MKLDHLSFRELLQHKALVERSLRRKRSRDEDKSRQLIEDLEAELSRRRDQVFQRRSHGTPRIDDRLKETDHG